MFPPAFLHYCRSRSVVLDRPALPQVLVKRQ